MATFNITAGTGGIDSSIYFELDRPEVRHSLFLFKFLRILISLRLSECWRRHGQLDERFFQHTE